MCGITGKIVFENNHVDPAEIQRMNTAIAHRGPDGAGVYISPNHKVGLGHRRLSIIDLSSAGAQPMRYLDRYEIVFNGEIYNFQEKRSELEQKGYRFSSHTDTEIIMALYDAYGVACLQHLRGMFAFALYDEQKNELFCARDRTGQKPFKYFIDGKVFIFASEIKAIITQQEYVKEVDEDAVQQFLTLQYTPLDSTGFKNIRKLLPAEYMVLNCATGSIERKKYWNIEYQPKEQRSIADWKQVIISQLRKSVHEQMVADVPIGAMLSGGIDSSIIVALMAEYSSSPIETFSVGFRGEEVSELPYAALIARRFNTSHHELRVSPTSVDALPMLVKTMEEPFGDHGALPTMLISELIRKHVTVALNGDGGDENFAGYDRYTAYAASSLLKPAARLLQMLASIAPGNILRDRHLRFIKTLQHPDARRYLEYVSYIPASVTGAFQNNSVMQEYANSKSLDYLDKLLHTDFHTYLPGALLPKVDMATMAYSLEARSPFLDHEILELTAKIPSKLKIHGFTNRKYILKEVCRGLIPDEIINRKKRGFGIPLEKWFQEDLFVYATALLTSPNAKLTTYISKEYITSTLHTHKKEPVRGRQIWIMLMLELWLKEYFS